MATTSITVEEKPLVRYLLGRADDALVLGHRLSEWTGRAPMLEEELALANIGLDLIGQARSLYQYAAQCEGMGHDEDDFAYLRDPSQYLNVLLVEQPNGDFAHTIVRQVLYSAFADPYWRAVMQAPDQTLAAIAAKSEKESAYHLRHASEWLIRLGDGTPESHRRAQAALDALWPYAGELFDADTGPLDPSTLRPGWERTLAGLLTRSTLVRPADWVQRGGRAGRHSEHLGHLLAAMQHLPRSFPGATW